MFEKFFFKKIMSLTKYILSGYYLLHLYYLKKISLSIFTAFIWKKTCTEKELKDQCYTHIESNLQ